MRWNLLLGVLLLSPFPVAAQEREIQELLKRIQQHREQPDGLAQSLEQVKLYRAAKASALRAQKLLKGDGLKDEALDRFLEQGQSAEQTLRDAQTGSAQRAAVKELAAVRADLEKRANIVLYGSADTPVRGELLLPDMLPKAGDYVGYKHLIFVDASPDEKLHDVFTRNSEQLKQRLRGIGVVDADIVVSPIVVSISDADFLAKVNAQPGKKRLYHIGHALPLSMGFAKGCVNIDRMAKELCAADVRSVASNGCSFLQKQSVEVRYFIENIPDGSGMTLYGFDTPARASQNSPYDTSIRFYRMKIEKSAGSASICTEYIARESDQTVQGGK